MKIIIINSSFASGKKENYINKRYTLIYYINTIVNKMSTLKSIFTSKTRIKLLNILLFSDKQYHLRDLSRKIKISPIYTSKELKNLESADLVKKERLANLTLYKINDNNKIISDLRSLFKKCKN